ncbi:MAG: hypothetical protein HY260_12060 [Chloroflexi bacterium]|nr:hypothetical protein [Chloroflexota bacterium]
MPKTLRYRLFKIGAMPETLRAEIKNDQLLFVEEGVAVTVRRKGSAPGFKGGGWGAFSGAFAITNQRIVASISSTVVVNAPYSGKDASGAEMSLAGDGLHVAVDASIHPRCTGEIRMHFKQEFSEEELARFPQRRLAFQFPVDLVPKMFGVPA